MISIFGATGFIGSNFCRMYNDTIQIPRESNITESSDILYLISTVDNYNIFSNPYIDIETNIIKLVNVLEECRKQQVTFNFISSWFVYGNCEYPKKESNICNPVGFYSVTKHTAERIVEEYGKTFNIPYRILRLPNVVGGIDQKASSKKNVLQNTINLLKNDQPVQLFNAGIFERDYMHVNDVCRAIELVIKSSPVNNIYNIGTGISTRFIDLVKFAKINLNSSSELHFVDTPVEFKHFYIPSCQLDVTKLRYLGHTANTGIYETVTSMINYHV